MDIFTLKRFFEGKYSHREYESIRKSFENFENNPQLLELVKSHWKEFQNHEPDSESVDHLLDKIHQRIELIERSKTRWTFVLRVFERTAAILILPIVISFFVYLQMESVKNNQQEAYAEIICPLGTRTKFTLPDGTTGFLNSGSTLTYPLNFVKNRHVRLTGEALFDVAPHNSSQFVVQSNHLNIVVKGTKFDVIAYENEAIEEVILLEGKIELKDIEGSSIVTLLPDQRFTYNNTDKSITTKTVTASHYASWTEGKLVFRNEDMKQVALRLGRWYNANIVVNDANLNDFTIHATFVDEPLDEVMKLLALTSPIEVREEERIAESNGFYPVRNIEIVSDPMKINQFH